MEELLNDQKKVMFLGSAAVILFDLAFAFFMFLRTKRFLANTKQTRGTISRIEQRGKQREAAIIAFEDKQRQGLSN